MLSLIVNIIGLVDLAHLPIIVSGGVPFDCLIPGKLLRVKKIETYNTCHLPLLPHASSIHEP